MAVCFLCARMIAPNLAWALLCTIQQRLSVKLLAFGSRLYTVFNQTSEKAWNKIYHHKHCHLQVLESLYLSASSQFTKILAGRQCFDHAVRDSFLHFIVWFCLSRLLFALRGLEDFPEHPKWWRNEFTHHLVCWTPADGLVRKRSKFQNGCRRPWHCDHEKYRRRWEGMPMQFVWLFMLQDSRDSDVCYLVQTA